MADEAVFDNVATLAAITQRVAELSKLDSPTARDIALLADQLLAARGATDNVQVNPYRTIVEIACEIMRLLAIDIASGQVSVAGDPLKAIARTLLVLESAAYEQAGRPLGGNTAAEELKALALPDPAIDTSASSARMIAETTCLVMRMLAADVASGQLVFTLDQLQPIASELHLAINGMERTCTAAESAVKTLEMAKVAAQLAAVSVGTHSNQKDRSLAQDCARRAVEIVEWSQLDGANRAEFASFGAVLSAWSVAAMAPNKMLPSLERPTADEMLDCTISEATSGIISALLSDILFAEVRDTSHHLNLLADAAQVLAASTRLRLAKRDLEMPTAEELGGHVGSTHGGELRPAVAAQLAAQLTLVTKLTELAAGAAQVDALLPELHELTAVADKVALLVSEFGDAPPRAGLAVLGAVLTAAVTAAELASHTRLEIARRKTAGLRSELTTHEIAAREAAFDASTMAGSIVVRTTRLILLVVDIECEPATSEHLEELAEVAEELADEVRRVARESARQAEVVLSVERQSTALSHRSHELSRPRRLGAVSSVERQSVALPMAGVEDVSYTTRGRAYTTRHRDWQARRVFMYAPKNLVEIAQHVSDLVRIARNAVDYLEVSSHMVSASLNNKLVEGSASVDSASRTFKLSSLATAAHKYATTIREDLKDIRKTAEELEALAEPDITADTVSADHIVIEATSNIMSMIADDIGSARAAGVGRAPPEDRFDDHHAVSVTLLADLAAAADWLLAAIDERGAAGQTSRSGMDVTRPADLETDAPRQAWRSHQARRAAQTIAEKTRRRPQLALMLDQLAAQLSGLSKKAPRAVNSEVRPSGLPRRTKRATRATRAALASQLHTFLTELSTTAARLAELAETVDKANDRAALAVAVDQRASRLAASAEAVDSTSLSVRASDLAELAEAIDKAPLAAAIAQRVAQLAETADTIDSAPPMARIVHRDAQPSEMGAVVNSAESGASLAVLAAAFPVVLAAEAIADLIIAEIANRSIWGAEEVEALRSAEDITTLADVTIVESTRCAVTTLAVATARGEHPAVTPGQFSTLINPATVLAAACRREVESLRSGLKARDQI